MAKNSQRSLFGGEEGGSQVPAPKGTRRRGRTLDLAQPGAVQTAIQAEVAEAAAEEAASRPRFTPGVEPDTLAGTTTYVIDAHSLIFQVFHAIPEMTSPSGQMVNAVYGFARDILFLLEEKKPDFIFAAFDMSGPTFRHELYEGYKADRKEMPDELGPQIDWIRKLLEALQIPILESEAFEADDILATVARRVEELGGDCVLVTGDKDARQLITDHVKVLNIRKNEPMDAQGLFADWGIRPDQVVDFQSLVGDSVDSVPGVPLIGPKIAGELLTKFDNLDELLSRTAEMPKGKRRENLEKFKEQALLSRELVRLDAYVPIDLRFGPAYVAAGVEVDGGNAIFRQMGFRSFPERLEKFRRDFVPSPWVATYKTVATLAGLTALVAEMGRQKVISIDTETTSLHPRMAELVGLSFAWIPGEGYYVPVKGPAGEECIACDAALRLLKPLLEDPAIAKVGQNLKYDQLVLRAVGVNLAGVSFDTMLASYLLEAGERNHGLDDLAKRHLNHANIPISALIGTGKDEKRMDEVTIARVAEYAAEDADVALRLYPLLEERIREDELAKLLSEVEVPLIDVLVEMEFNGVRVETARLAELSEAYGQRMAAIETEIYRLADGEFNIGSPKQLAEVLFDQLKLPVVRKTKTGPSTDADVLEELAPLHPLPAKIVEYRQYAKLKGTYLDALPALVVPSTGRVHTSFNQTVAATGRLSSNDPNLQNIPIRTSEGREIRSAFRAGPEGWKLVAADYSQIELRVLAHYSGDATLCEAFERDEDIHTRVASEVYGVPLDQVSGEQRRSAKAINFGILYGQSPFGLAKNLGIEQDEAARFIEAYFANYPGIDEFMWGTLADCRRQGYVKTILGRRRAIAGIRDVAVRRALTNPIAARQRNLPERTAINTVIQGSAADLIKLAMLAVHRRLRDERFESKLLLQIHDELMFESPPDEIERLSAMVREAMSGVMDLRVPLKVDVKVGDNWAEC